MHHAETRRSIAHTHSQTSRKCPESKRPWIKAKLINWAHTVLASGHPGTRTMLEMIKEKHSCSTHKDDVCLHVLLVPKPRFHVMSPQEYCYFSNSTKTMFTHRCPHQPYWIWRSLIIPPDPTNSCNYQHYFYFTTYSDTMVSPRTQSIVVVIKVSQEYGTMDSLYTVSLWRICIKLESYIRLSHRPMGTSKVLTRK